jgi:hypothetical protein
MQELIEADILIMAKSSFSYVSALLSDGIKIYEPWLGYPPLGSWVILGPNGEFDCVAFERQLLRHIESRNALSSLQSSTNDVALS